MAGDDGGWVNLELGVLEGFEVGADELLLGEGEDVLVVESDVEQVDGFVVRDDFVRLDERGFWELGLLRLVQGLLGFGLGGRLLSFAIKRLFAFGRYYGLSLFLYLRLKMIHVQLVIPAA